MVEASTTSAQTGAGHAFRPTTMLSMVPAQDAPGQRGNGERQPGIDRAKVVAALPPRLQEVGKLACAGMGNKAIALRLGITEATVKVHLKGLCRRLRVQNRTGLLAIFGPQVPHDASFAPGEEDRRILDLVCRGSTNQEIAAATGLKDAYVKVCVRRLCAAAKVANRTALAAWYLVHVGREARPDDAPSVWSYGMLEQLRGLIGSATTPSATCRQFRVSELDLAEGLALLIRQQAA